MEIVASVVETVGIPIIVSIVAVIVVSGIIMGGLSVIVVGIGLFVALNYDRTQKITPTRVQVPVEDSDEDATRFVAENQLVSTDVEDVDF